MTGANFICPSCKKQHSISSYTITGTGVFLSRGTRQPLRCDCPKKVVLENIPQKWDGGAPTVGRIANMTPQQRSEVLKKRSKAHFKKEIQERKVEMNRTFNNDIKNLAEK